MSRFLDSLNSSIRNSDIKLNGCKRSYFFYVADKGKEYLNTVMTYTSVKEVLIHAPEARNYRTIDTIADWPTSMENNSGTIQQSHASFPFILEISNKSTSLLCITTTEFSIMHRASEIFKIKNIF
jgi:hypothetical protein